MSVQVDMISEIAKLSFRLIDGPVLGFFRRGGEDRLSVRAEQLQLLQDLTAAQIDPTLFDLMLSSELDRTLKKQFGIAFFVATLAATAASYAVIILNAINHWAISDIAITALIVETPIQFIGLLYIIARNLFPQRQMAAEARAAATTARPAATPRTPRQPRTAEAPARVRRGIIPSTQEGGDE
jgi:hypothetical protein